jgi:hypothetical protein
MLAWVLIGTQIWITVFNWSYTLINHFSEIGILYAIYSF